MLVVPRHEQPALVRPLQELDAVAPTSARALAPALAQGALAVPRVLRRRRVRGVADVLRRREGRTTYIRVIRR